MAKNCIKCGKIIGILSNDPLVINDTDALCFDCAKPISGDINRLYYVKNSNRFFELKDEILNKSHELYNETITNNIGKKIDQIYDSIKTNLLEQDNIEKEKAIRKNYLITTGFDFSGYKIKDYLGVCSGEVVLGTGFLSEFTASFADFFGDESNMFSNKLETAKNAAIEKMISKSLQKGGNALIGVDFDYITFRNNMIGVVANGTSVVVEKE